ncbi:hypothetical protein F4809DRAFT_540254 [Biscogniauxia mediterranea]|nr:hypothetical protein F4809DRAFT_540254 [Biscogniauxia mediterranea]
MSIVTKIKRLFRKWKERKPNPKPNPGPDAEPEPESQPPYLTTNDLKVTRPAVSAEDSQRTSPRNDQYEDLSESTTEPPRTVAQQPRPDNSDQEPRIPNSLEPESEDRQSLSRDNGIRPDPNCTTKLYVYPRVPSGRFEFPTAFTATKCLQKTSYINKTAAKRLGLGDVEGAKHVISWRSWDKQLRRSTFVVVSDDFMHTEVALGTEWSVDESESNQIVRVPNSDDAHNRQGNLNQSLFSQHDNSHNIIQPLPSSRALGSAPPLNSLMLPPRFTIMLSPMPTLPNPYATLPVPYADIIIRLMDSQPPSSQWGRTQDFSPQNHPLQYNRNFDTGINARARL